MARLIQDTIRRALADELLFGRLANGGKVTVDVDATRKWPSSSSNKRKPPSRHRPRRKRSLPPPNRPPSAACFFSRCPLDAHGSGVETPNPSKGGNIMNAKLRLAAAVLAAAPIIASAQTPYPHTGRDLAASCAICHGTGGVNAGGLPTSPGRPRII